MLAWLRTDRRVSAIVVAVVVGIELIWLRPAWLPVDLALLLLLVAHHPTRRRLAELHAAAIDSPPGPASLPRGALISHPARVGHQVPTPIPTRGLPGRGSGLYRSGVSASPGGVALTPGRTA